GRPFTDGGLMTSRTRSFPRCTLFIAVAVWGCADRPTEVRRVPAVQFSAVKFWDVTASTRWNERATDLLQGLPPGPPSNGQAWASRMLTYLSLAQYRAVQAAMAPSARPIHASVSAAVASASFDVLNAFFVSAPLTF